MTIVTVTVGGREYDIPEMNFVALERAWPYVEEVLIQRGLLEAMDGGLRIIASSLMEAEGFSMEAYNIDPDKIDPVKDRDNQIFELVVLHLKRNLKAREMGDISLAINEIVKANGLEAEEGEAPATEEKASMETGAPSSQNSSQLAVKEEAGKA